MRPSSTCAAGCCCPGFVDTHVHFPQIRAIGGLGMPLLDWLERCALPEEGKLADDGVRRGGGRGVPRRAGRGPARRRRWCSARTSRPRWTPSSPRPGRPGCGSPPAWCCRRPDTAPGAAHHPGAGLGGGEGADRALARPAAGLRYAVTPRFSLSASDADARRLRGAPAGGGRLVHLPHQRERGPKSRRCAELFPGAHYLDTYRRHALVNDAQRVRPQRPRRRRRAATVMAGTGAWVAHCPTSNSALGSGLFPLPPARRSTGTASPSGPTWGRAPVLPAQGGATGLLRPAAARPRGATACRAAHLLHLAHRGRRRGAGPGGHGRATSRSARPTTPCG